MSSTENQIEKLYSEFELNVLNGVFWQAITNEVTEPLTNKQWTSKYHC